MHHFQTPFNLPVHPNKLTNDSTNLRYTQLFVQSCGPGLLLNTTFIHDNQAIDEKANREIYNGMW